MNDLDGYPYEVRLELQEIAEAHAKQARLLPLTVALCFVAAVAVLGLLGWAAFHLTDTPAHQIVIALVLVAAAISAVGWYLFGVLFERIGRMEAHLVTLHRLLIEKGGSDAA
jgi:hypothetical protein